MSLNSELSPSEVLGLAIKSEREAADAYSKLNKLAFLFCLFFFCKSFKS